MKPCRRILNAVTIAFLGLLLAGCGKPREKGPKNAEAQNDLPSMEIFETDGNPVKVKNLTGNVILILFQTDCDHCQREAAALQQNIKAFGKYSLYFITTTTIPEIDAFATQFKLKDYDNVRFCRTSNQSILDNFGPIDAPSLYIYSNKVLVKAFNGETDINEILKYI